MATQTIQITISPEELEVLLQKNIQAELEKVISKITPQTKEKEFLNRKEAIEFLGISYVCLHDWTKKGLIIGHKLGNKNFYRYSDIVDRILQKKD